MRATYRSHGGNLEYWRARWETIDADDAALNINRYPGVYANRAVENTKGLILEAGCGSGRVLRHFHDQGRDIVGFDFVEIALHKISAVDASVPLVTGNILHLPFADRSFSCVLAFGLYHNLEEGLKNALAETMRVTATDGVLCASFRADNFQNRFIDALAAEKPRKGRRQFHKMNYTVGEIRDTITSVGFEIKSLEYVENMPFLHKFKTFRHRAQRRFDEHSARAKGYQLSPLGSALQRTMMSLAPQQFCNVYVATAIRR